AAAPAQACAVLGGTDDEAVHAVDGEVEQGFGCAAILPARTEEQAGAEQYLCGKDAAQPLLCFFHVVLPPLRLPGLPAGAASGVACRVAAGGEPGRQARRRRWPGRSSGLPTGAVRRAPWVAACG